MNRRWLRDLRLLVGVTALLLVITTALGPVHVVVAQSVGSCAAPALVPGSPTPLDELNILEEASETDSLADTVSGAAGRPVDNATADRVIAGIENFVACRNAGDFTAYAALLTSNRIHAEAGTDNPYDVVADLQGFNLPITILSLGDVQHHADGRFSAEFVHLFGPHLYYRSRLYVVEEDGFVKFDEERFLPEAPSGDQSVVDVAIVDFAFAVTPDAIPNAAYVILRGMNTGNVTHQIVVARLPEAVTVEQVLTGAVPEDQVEFIGQTVVAPGHRDDLVLVQLEPGSYTVICLADEPDGMPHAARGMVATFAVI